MSLSAMNLATDPVVKRRRLCSKFRSRRQSPRATMIFISPGLLDQLVHTPRASSLFTWRRRRDASTLLDPASNDWREGKPTVDHPDRDDNGRFPGPPLFFFFLCRNGMTPTTDEQHLFC